MFNLSKYCLIRVGLVVARRSFVSSACPPHTEIDPTLVQVSELPNGMRIVTDQSPSFMSALGVYIQAGPRHEHSCNNGITHVISHLIFKGTKSFPKDKIEEFCHCKQVRFDTHTYRDMLGIRAFFIDPQLANEILNIFATIINEFQFNKELFDDEKFNLCVEAVDYEYNPRKLIFDYLHQAAFQCTTMGQKIIGSTENFQKIDRQMMDDFVKRQFQPNNIVISATGPIDHEHILCAAVNAFQSESLDCQKSSYGNRFVSSDIRYRDDSMPYVHVAVAFEAPCLGHEDYLPMLMAKCMFGSWQRGQGGGFNQRHELAQAGDLVSLCVLYKSFYFAYRDVGLWGFYFVSDMMAAEDMLILLQKNLTKMILMTTKNDVKYGMVLLRRELEKRNSNVFRRVHDNAVQVMYTGTVHKMNDYSVQLPKYEKPSHFTDVLDNYLYDRGTVSAAIGPTENVSDMLRIRAATWWLRF